MANIFVENNYVNLFKSLYCIVFKNVFRLVSKNMHILTCI